MKRISYRIGITFVAICFSVATFAQKVERKFTENFKVHKDVEVSINATNTDINVTTWNKNEVAINAFIEIEGLSKEEAESYIKKWKFEALGNKKKVKIVSKGGNSLGFDDDFVFFNDNNFRFPDIEVISFDSLNFPDMMDFEMPDIDFVLSDFDFDLDEFMEEGGEYNFQWKHGGRNIVIKSKKEWETFKKSKEYKELKKDLKKGKEKFKKEWGESKIKIKNFDKAKLKEALREAKLEIKNIDKEEIRRELAKAAEQLKNLKFDFLPENNEADIIINGKKIKIKKRLEIKVPKNATFDLNTRHCKIKLPNTVASGTVKYGTFTADNLKGGELKINYAPVIVNNLNECTLSLNNVTDAKIASVTNTKLSNNSSEVRISKVNENVDISCKFGELTILNMKPNYQSFKLFLDYGEATINAASISKKLLFNNAEKPIAKFKLLDSKKKDFNGNFIIKTNDETLFVEGKYSQITFEK